MATGTLSKSSFADLHSRIAVTVVMVMVKKKEEHEDEEDAI